MNIPDLDLDFSPIPDLGIKKVPDPGSGSATLITGTTFCLHGLGNELISHFSVSYGDR
jgi:hypothetical protein